MIPNHVMLFCFYPLQLAYCVVQFLEKDPSLTEQVRTFNKSHDCRVSMYTFRLGFIFAL